MTDRMRRNSYGYPYEDAFDQSEREQAESRQWPSGWFILPAATVGALLWWWIISWL